MSEQWQRRSALTGVYREGVFGPLGHGVPGITVRECRGRAITQIDAFPDSIEAVREAVQTLTGLAPPEQACRAVAGEKAHILWTGPGRWWIVTRDGDDPAAALAGRVGDAAAVTEQGHGRCALRVKGRAVRDLLAKGSTIDFHPARFTAGTALATGLLQIPAQLHCLTDEPVVDIYVARSMAVSFYEWLTESAGEYGCSVESPIVGL